MKKVMLGVLVIIPIVIMLIVGLVTSFVSTQAYIGVESLTMDKDAVRILLSEIEPDEKGHRVVDMNDYITVKVTPDRATNKTVEWSIRDSSEDGEVAGAQLVEKTDDGYDGVKTNTTGLLEVTDYCVFRIAASAEGHSDDCIVEVTDSDVQSITLSGATELRTGDKALLSPSYSPAGSIVTQSRWTSSDEDVAVVDANGVVTAVGEGSAVITMSAYRERAGEWVEDENSGKLTVTVKKGASLYGSVVYTASDTVDLAAAGVTDTRDVTGGSVADGILTVTAADGAVVTTPEGEVRFILCAADAIVIAGAEFFTCDDGSGDAFTLGIGEIPLSLTAVWKAQIGAPSEAPSVTWSTSDENIASVDKNGVVTAVSPGKVLISATSEGGTADFELRVVNKISVFRLDLDEKSLEVGLARETLFAAYRFDPSHTLTSDDYDYGTEFFVPNIFEVEIVLPLPPASDDEKAEFYAAFVFSTDDPEVAYFADGSNVLTFVPEKITERTEVKISVKARYPRDPSLEEQTLTITVIPAVEVNDANEFFVAARTTHYYDKYFTNYASVNGDNNMYLVYRDRVYNDRVKGRYEGDIVLGSDIAYCDVETGESLVTAYEAERARLNNNVTAPNYEAELCCSLYGNGHQIYATSKFINEGFNGLGGDAYDHGLVLVREEGGVVSNVTISPNYDIGDEIADVGSAEALNGYALRMRGVGQESKYATHDPNNEFIDPTVEDPAEQLTHCTVEYSILQNGSSALGLDGVDCTLDGVVIRNTGGTGIYVPTSIDTEWDLYIDDTPGDVKFSILRTNNCVMSNMIGTAASFEFKRFTKSDGDAFGGKVDPDDPDGRTYYRIALDNGCYSTLIQEGFLDIYNWQRLNALGLLNESTLGEYAELKDLLSGALSGVLSTNKFSYLVRNYDGEAYVHFGFISTGLNEPSFLDPHFANDRYVEVTSDELLPGLNEFVKNPLRIWCYTAGENSIVPGSTYTINTRFIDRLHQA